MASYSQAKTKVLPVHDQSKNRLKAWLDRMPRGNMNTATHLSLSNGMACISDSHNIEFLTRYAQDIDAGFGHCWVERIMQDDVAPFFIEIDYVSADITVPETYEDKFKMQIVKWCQAIAEAVSELCNDDDNDDMDVDLRDCDMQAARDSMEISSCLILTAPARAKEVDGTDAVKVGIHMIWPNLVVTKDTAQRLREIALTALYRVDRHHDWVKDVDASVYRPRSGLRMLGSYKAMPCRQYKGNTIERSEIFQQNKSKIIRELKIKLDATFEQLQEAYSAKVADNKPISPMLSSVFNNPSIKFGDCSLCRGTKKIADPSIGFYTIAAVIDGDGNLLEGLLNKAKSDWKTAVYLASVRRNKGTECTSVTIPQNAPIKLQVILDEVGGELKMIESTPSEMLNNKYFRSPLDNEDRTVAMTE